MKYTIRKLGFLLLIAAAIATPWIITEVERRTTTDPHIIMAREIAEFPSGGINVVNVFQAVNDLDKVIVLLHIPDYPDWASKDRENLKRFVLNIVRGTRYQRVDVAIGWDYTAETLRVQGMWVCEGLFAADCEWSKTNIAIKPSFIKWPKEGRP